MQEDRRRGKLYLRASGRKDLRKKAFPFFNKREDHQWGKELGEVHLPCLIFEGQIYLN